jgi:hypothetical protein
LEVKDAAYVRSLHDLGLDVGSLTPFRYHRFSPMVPKRGVRSYSNRARCFAFVNIALVTSCLSLHFPSANTRYLFTLNDQHVLTLSAMPTQPPRRRISQAFVNAPPAYTPVAYSSEVDPQALVTDSEKAVQIARAGVRLQRYFVEIIAYMIKTDFKKLNAAIPMEWQISSNRSFTIMSNPEKAELLRMCQVIDPMCRQLLASSSNDRTMVLHEILEPASKMQVEPGYALDLIASYANHKCSIWKRNRTIVEQLKRQKNGDAASDLRKTLESLALLICLVAPDEATRCVLGTALERCQRKCKFDKIKIGKTFFPLEKDCVDLAQALMKGPGRTAGLPTHQFRWSTLYPNENRYSQVGSPTEVTSSALRASTLYHLPISETSCELYTALLPRMEQSLEIRTLQTRSGCSGS